GGDTPCIPVQVHRSRTLPGHELLRVARFGHGLSPAQWEQAIRVLVDQARHGRRVLRLNLEVFVRSGMPEMREILTRYGFVTTQPRSYQDTLTLPVNADDEVLLSKRKSLRKRLREAEKCGVFVTPLLEERYGDRIVALQQIAMQRSGGTFRIPDWNTILRFSAGHPELSCVVGMFPSAQRTEPSDLMGFGWGCMHGDHAEYRAAGAADLPTELRSVSVSHPLLWHLIRWSRDMGATWFDMGGITVKNGSDDPLAGVSQTKRVLSETVEHVGEEWVFEPTPWKSRLARQMSWTADKLSRLRNR
ncbi:MAG: hypothetical protein V4734_10690, partial [Terriglobus sp.]